MFKALRQILRYLKSLDLRTVCLKPLGRKGVRFVHMDHMNFTWCLVRLCDMGTEWSILVLTVLILYEHPKHPSNAVQCRAMPSGNASLINIRLSAGVSDADVC